MSADTHYLSGFNNILSSEAMNGALPAYQNSPQNCPLGLYAEQLSGTAFTKARHTNLKSWLYRIQPSVVHQPFEAYSQAYFTGKRISEKQSPNQLRWRPLPMPEQPQNFLAGLIPWLSTGQCIDKSGGQVFLYTCNQTMGETFFYSCDGEWLIIPQEGSLMVNTEFGPLTVAPHEIVVIPRGIKFQVNPEGQTARGYVLENHGIPFSLPELGVIGANALADPRNFYYPKAQFFQSEGNFQLITKFNDHLWQSSCLKHPLNVVAWQGNYAPYKYDLRRFNTINTVSFDHPDPSIFTVLTSLSAEVGTANLDFVIFPERWMVAEHTFRPPYFHRNTMSEYMGLISGNYDAKPDGFVPGGGSLHNCMMPHGPDATAYKQAIALELKPDYFASGLAFMFESKTLWCTTNWANDPKLIDDHYLECWQKLPQHFAG